MAVVTKQGFYGTSRGGPFGDFSGKAEAEVGGRGPVVAGTYRRLMGFCQHVASGRGARVILPPFLLWLLHRML